MAKLGGPFTNGPHLLIPTRLAIDHSPLLRGWREGRMTLICETKATDAEPTVPGDRLPAWSCATLRPADAAPERQRWAFKTTLHGGGKMKQMTVFFLALFALLMIGSAGAQESPARVTILYDAFGKPSTLKRGWGYSALVEYGGKRVLFDTGGDNNDFAFNVKTLGVDLTRLDFVVLTHRHGDHTSGLNYVLSVNPGVKIYTPAEGAAFGTPSPPGLMKLIQRKVDSVPEDLRYFGGNPPEKNSAGTPWPGANFVQIRQPTEVLPGFFLFSTQSDVTGTKE